MYGKALATPVCKKIVGENPITSTARDNWGDGSVPDRREKIR